MVSSLPPRSSYLEDAEKLQGVMDAANTRYTELEAQHMTEIEELKAANLDLTRRCEFLEESLNREKSEKFIAVESYEKEKQERESAESSQELLTLDLERVTQDAKRFSEQGGSNAGGSAGGGPLEFLRNNQEFQKFRDLVYRKPESLEPILQGLSEKNPQIIRLIDENYFEFLQFLSEPFEVGEGDLEQPEQDERPHVVFVTPEELEAIGRLESMGFERARVLEAFWTCDGSEEHAANYLLEHRGEEE